MSPSFFSVSALVLFFTIGLTACAEDASAPAASTNHAPAPTAPPVITSKGAQGSTQVKANDPDADDTHTFVVSKDGEHGTVYMGAQGMLVYLPRPEFAGVDRFEVTVTDNHGVTAATQVAAVVKLAPADPTATADLTTFKNTPAAYVVFADQGVPSGFSVSSAPANGAAGIDAQGMLTYSPNEGFAGKDAVGVSIALTNGAVTDVTVTVAVINRAPKPTAAGIHTGAGTPGKTTVYAGDADPRDTAKFSIVIPPKRGTALVNEQGQVSYLPSIASGEDSFTVQVVDGSGARARVNVDVTVRIPATAGLAPDGGFLPEVCKDGINRVLVTELDPPAQTQLGSPVTITAKLAYSVAATTTIGIMDNASNPVTSVTVEPGCSVVTISGAYSSKPGVATAIVPFPNGQQMFFYPSRSFNTLSQTGFWTESLGGPVIDYFVLFEETFLFLFHQIAVDFGLGNFVRADFKPQSSVLHVRRPNMCNQAFRTVDYAGNALTYTGGRFAAPNIPPSVAVAPLLMNLPVTSGSTYTVTVGLESCGAPLDVTLSTSHEWFALSATTVTLNSSATVRLTVDGKKLAEGGRPTEGVLLLRPADGSLPEIEIPVSAYRFDSVDPSAYSPVALAGGFGPTVEIPLPWDFPFEGVTYPAMKVMPDGALCGVPFGGACQSLGVVIAGGLDSYMPGYVGGPLFAPLWNYPAATHNEPGEPKSGIYSRSVSDTAEPHFEILWWDVSSPWMPDSHNVYRMILYPDGRFTYDYPSVQPMGWEVVTWWDFMSTPGFELQGIDLHSGDTYLFGPVE